VLPLVPSSGTSRAVWRPQLAHAMPGLAAQPGKRCAVAAQLRCAVATGRGSGASRKEQHGRCSCQPGCRGAGAPPRSTRHNCGWPQRCGFRPRDVLLGCAARGWPLPAHVQLSMYSCQCPAVNVQLSMSSCQCLAAVPNAPCVARQRAAGWTPGRSQSCSPAAARGMHTRMVPVLASCVHGVWRKLAQIHKAAQMWHVTCACMQRGSGIRRGHCCSAVWTRWWR
jgi:hypothetical protein